MKQIFIVEYKLREGVGNGPKEYQQITLLADGKLGALADAYARYPLMDLMQTRVYPRGCARREPMLKSL